MFKCRCLFILFVCLTVTTSVCAATTLVLNTSGTPPLNTPDQTGFADEIVAEAFKRIGIRLKTVQLPAERGLKNANAGVEDGDMLRVAGLDKIYTNLICVPESIMSWEFVVFSKHKVNLQQGWKSLSNHYVAFINGWKILEKNVPASAHINKMRNLKQLFSFLNKDRTDMVIYERWGGLLAIKEMHMKQIKLQMPPLTVKKMYIYLHKKHQAIVQSLTNALKTMKTDGSYNKIKARVLTPLTW